MIRRLFFGFGVVIALSAPALAELAMTGAPVVMRAAQRGVIHKNTASRKVSRLTARVKALTKAA